MSKERFLTQCIASSSPRSLLQETNSIKKEMKYIRKRMTCYAIVCTHLSFTQDTVVVARDRVEWQIVELF